MKTIKFSELQSNPQLYKQVGEALSNGDLVCIPTPSGYKLMADLGSPSAVTAMIHAKRRVKNAPALVLLPDRSWADKVASFISQDAHTLMDRFWPGPVTLLFKAGDSLHPKVRKPLTKAKGWLGVRVPEDDVSSRVIAAFGKPVLVSSANLAKKKGAHSIAQVKKNFGRTVNLLIDAGDLSPGEKSTLVDVSNGAVSVVRSGAIAKDSILEALAG